MIKQSQGWTLLELVLVIFLMMLLSVMIFPKRFEITDFKKKLAVSELAAIFQIAQKQSMLLNCSLSLQKIDSKLQLKAVQPCQYETHFKSELSMGKMLLYFFPDGHIEIDQKNTDALIWHEGMHVQKINIVEQTGLIYVSSQ